MASITRQEPRKPPIAALIRSPGALALARRPATSIHNLQSGQELPLDKNALVDFAVKATTALREQSNSLAKQHKPHPFFAILSSLLSDVEGRLDKTASPTESRVSRLLWPIPFKEPASPYNSSSYPFLVRTLYGAPRRARSCIKNLAETPGENVSEDRKKFQKSFKAFANVKRELRGPELLDLAKSNTRPVLNDDTNQCLQNLYSTLCQLCRCTVAVSSGDFKANVALDVAQSTGADDGVVVDLFFLHRHLVGNHETGEWKEARIRAFLERGRSVTRSDTGNSSTESNGLRFKQTGKKILGFCRLIRSQELGRLKLSASGSGLFDEGVESFKGNGFSPQAPSVSLARVLKSASLNKDEQRKVLLSYLLAKAVWLFYESDWMAEDWTKHTVQFMQQRLDKLQNDVLLNHRPFISAELRALVPRLNPASYQQDQPQEQEHECKAEPPRQSHIFPKILALGIMLLEIELGEGIENRHRSEFLNSNGQPRENAGHITAGFFITSVEWKHRHKVLKTVKQAIEICVTPDTGKLGTDRKRVRDKLYEYVVVPLGELFNTMYDCPDRCPEKFDPGPINVGSSDGLCDTAFMLGLVNMQAVRQAPNSASTLQPSHITEVSPFLCSVEAESHQIRCSFGLFDTHDSYGNLSHLSDKWFSDLDTKLDFLRPVFKPTSTRHRVRVAILDTGITINDDFLESRKGRIRSSKSFITGESSTEDEIGHGTHVAALLLKVAPYADIFVARVSKSGDLENPDYIANAISHAISAKDDGWGVDIISMSFGFSPDAPNLGTIRAAISAAYAKRVVMFAAARNSGGNTGIAYPANQDEVICINSTDGYGNKSLFNPTPRLGRNLSILGQDIELMSGHDGETVCKSGTSFATPIAAGVAVLLLAYGREKLSSDEFEKLKSRRGIFEVFQRNLAEDRDGFKYIVPWKLFSQDEGRIKSRLQDTLCIF
ncbi:MAG: hypothetical protein M1829_006158 [Trizodia sp. TS-e1964]|nr:MAG: hypothetical protein M1829_006158 [Trizodia sp. TS-e1964]